jgi:hypothetical protein
VLKGEKRRRRSVILDDGLQLAGTVGFLKEVASKHTTTSAQSQVRGKEKSKSRINFEINTTPTPRPRNLCHTDAKFRKSTIHISLGYRPSATHPTMLAPELATIVQDCKCPASQSFQSGTVCSNVAYLSFPMIGSIELRWTHCIGNFQLWSDDSLFDR